MPLVITLVFLTAFFGLIVSSRVAFKRLSFFSRHLIRKDILLGILIVPIATSLPELFVGINAAFGKVSELSLANVVGSNIINLTLLIGLTAIFSRQIIMKGQTFSLESLFSFFILFLPFILLFGDFAISKIDGFILIAAFLSYYFYIGRKVKQERIVEEKKLRPLSLANFFIQFILFLVAITVLFLSANLLLKSGLALFEYLRLPSFLLGLVIISLGTALPDAAIDIVSAIKNRPGFAIGNLYGAIVANSGLVLGLVAIINPIVFNNIKFLANAIIYLSIATLLFLFFSHSKSFISWQEGIILVILYILFLITSFLLGTF